MVVLLRATIKRSEEVEDGLLFGLDRDVPCLLHLENRMSEKLIVMKLLEGLRYTTK